MLGIILGILTFVVVMYLDIQSDYKRIDTDGIKHKRGMWIRALALLPTFGCFYFPLESTTIWFIFSKMVIVVGLLSSWWFEFFDGLLNLKRGYSWRFNGSDDPDDAKTDNFLQNYTAKQQIIIKWGLILLFTSLYIYVYYLK